MRSDIALVENIPTEATVESDTIEDIPNSTETVIEHSSVEKKAR